MNILLLNTWRVINSKGGTEKVFCNMANALTDRGHTVLALACENKTGSPFFSLNSKVKFINIGNLTSYEKVVREILTVFEFRKVDRVRKRIKLRAYFMQKKLSPVIKNFNPDVIISFTSDGTFWLKSNKFCLNCPVITMYHFNAEIILKNDIYYESLEQSDCIQTLLNRDIKITKDIITPKKIVTIPNVVPQYVESAELKNKKIITVGRCEPKQKRTHILIEAFNLLKNKFPDWQVEIWGETNVDSKYYDYCENLIRKYNLQNIKFCGTTNNVEGVCKTASLFAFPSAYEGFGLALTEAMSMRLPAIGFKNCPAVNELIRDGKNGILCEDNVEDFARGLAELMGNSEKRKQYGTQAKEDMKQYAPEIIWNQWEKLIDEVVDNYKIKK